MNSQYRLRLDSIEKQNIEKERERDQHIFSAQFNDSKILRN